MSADTAPQKKEEKVNSSATYEAGCHCGYIKFSVTLTPALPETKVLNCNCSACTRFGYLLVCESLLLPLSHIRRHRFSSKGARKREKERRGVA
jgi:hypothetical protein